MDAEAEVEKFVLKAKMPSSVALADYAPFVIVPADPGTSENLCLHSLDGAAFKSWSGNREEDMQQFKAGTLSIAITLTLTTVFVPAAFAASPAPAPAEGQNGMVVTAHHLASQIGIDVLKSGGNAVDAAVAVGCAGRRLSDSRQPRWRRVHDRPPKGWQDEQDR